MLRLNWTRGLDETRLGILLGILAVVSVTAPWLAKPGYLFFVDFVSGPNSVLEWFTHGALAAVAQKMIGLLVGPALAQKLIIAVALGLLWLAGWKLASSLSDRLEIKAIIGLFLIYNPFVYDRLAYGQVYFLYAVALTGIGLSYLIKMFLRKQEPIESANSLRDKAKPWKPLIIAAACFGLAIHFSPHFIFLCLLIGLVWLAAILLSRPDLRRPGLAIAILTGTLIVLALNLNWLVGKHMVGKITLPNISQSDFTAFATSGDTGLEALTNVVMLSGFWGKDQHRYADLTTLDGNWGRSFLLLLPLMLLGLVTALRKRKSRYLAISVSVMILVATVLAVGVRLPLSREITLWLLDNLPFYKGLRETHKWASLILLGYALLMTWGLKWLLSKPKINYHRVTVTVLALLTVFMQAPLMVWGMRSQYRTHRYPESWVLADRVMVDDGCSGRLLFLPWHMYMSFHWSDTVIANPVRHFFSCPTVKGTNMEWGGIYDNSGSSTGARVKRWLNRKGQDGPGALSDLNIKYVLLAKEIDWNSYAWLGKTEYLETVSDYTDAVLYRVVNAAGDEIGPESGSVRQ